jgi:prepilin-type processing-associated H-X9-DG protein
MSSRLLGSMGSLRSALRRALAVLVVRRGGVMTGLLAVGAAILFPVFTRARERALQSECISNLKQIVVAAKMFSNDWDGVLPAVGTYPEGKPYGEVWTPGRDWRELIGDYLRGADQVFVCPAVKDQPAPSYGWNRHLSGYQERKIQFPTTTPLVWDWVPGELTAPGIPLDPDPESWDDWGYYPSGGARNKADMARACSRHVGGLIMGFVDGHAKFLRPTSYPGGQVMPCDDQAMPWPPLEERGVVISMYPEDPIAK